MMSPAPLARTDRTLPCSKAVPPCSTCGDPRQPLQPTQKVAHDRHLEPHRGREAVRRQSHDVIDLQLHRQISSSPQMSEKSSSELLRVVVPTPATLDI